MQASQLAHNQAIDNTLRGGGFFGEGGAVYVEGSAEIRNTDIFSNGAGNGGGIFNADIINPAATLQLIESTLRNNTAFSDGGGLYNEYAAFISNSTLSGNHAQGLGGAIFGTAFTLDISAGTTVLNSTLSDNRADDAAESDRAAPASSGVGIYVTLSNLGLGNTIIANSVGGADCISDSFGGINDFGHNLIESSTAACGLTDGSNGNIIADPLLAPLTDNMGPTLTHALLTNSPAIGAADQTICDAAPINGLDQRGFARDAACDIGAFEANGVPTAVTVRQSRTATAPFITVLLLALCLTAVSAKTGRPKSP